ncbi:Crp/Fnr family transcriptional regulator [Draconibacterium sp. IB214405]|uniref:Crp/Fnr family transcriptional regulator n=1 Tax=Draconibacterium sp. IB214405 TaxID=3097352 RepID=UPI002A150B05|nr:Crp/Fnr family transcriptional regulator [Draconibacterium sp. IB214405]MDX8338990.1 Crp/Fnr family transcriptional regulator [Draconibacterium sp. IB214405]
MNTIVQPRRRVQPIVNIDLGLRELPIFKKLSEEEMLNVELNSVVKNFSKRSVIYREGSRHSGLYCVLKGIVKVYKIGGNGKQQILKFAQKGDLIGYRSLLTNELACTSAKAYEDTVLYHIPQHIIMELFQQNWNFTHETMKFMCKELKESNMFITDIAQKSVRERAAEMLLILKDEFGVDKYNTLQITITREDLANMVGTVTESLIRVMSEFRNENLLELPGRKIVFRDIAKLKAIANI